MGQGIEFASNGGEAPGWLALPSPSAGNGKGVVVIQEWWGLNDHVKAVAERFAAAGFAALAPDLYHGKVTRSPDEAGKLLMALNIAGAEKDILVQLFERRVLTYTPANPAGWQVEMGNVGLHYYRWRYGQ